MYVPHHRNSANEAWSAFLTHLSAMFVTHSGVASYIRAYIKTIPNNKNWHAVFKGSARSRQPCVSASLSTMVTALALRTFLYQIHTDMRWYYWHTNLMHKGLIYLMANAANGTMTKACTRRAARQHLRSARTSHNKQVVCARTPVCRPKSRWGRSLVGPGSS